MASETPIASLSLLSDAESESAGLNLPRVSILSHDDEESDDEVIFHDAVSALTSPTKATAPSNEIGSGAAVDSDAAEPAESEKPTLTPEQLQALMAEKAFHLIEFYFGDDNYSKDQFLRKQASQDPTAQGWIPVEVIISFKKMKKITEDRAVVIDAMKKSSLVVLSEDETLIRRAEPLAKDVEDALTRTVVLGNFPASTTEESIRALCAPHGAITRVRMLTFGRDELPKDIQLYCLDERGAFRSGLRLVPQREYALVEYGVTKYANIAVRALPNDQDWRGGLQVALLHKRPKGDGSPASSQSASHAASPCVTPTVSSMIVERARTNSFNARQQRERSSSATAALQPQSDPHAATSDAPPDLPNFDGAQRPSSAAAHASPGAGPRTSQGDGAGWGAASPSRGSPRTALRSPSLSPQSARRHLSAPNTHPPGGHGSPSPRSTLSQSASPQTWRSAAVDHDRASPRAASEPHEGSGAGAAGVHGGVGSPSSPLPYRAGSNGPSPLRAVQHVTRQPHGPDGSKGFAGRRQAVAV